MILHLIKLANKLDKIGLRKESKFIDRLIKKANKVMLIKLAAFAFMGNYVITISTVDNTSIIGNAKSFKGKQEQIPLAKQYLDQLIKQYPGVKVTHDIKKPMTPEMFGLK